MKLLVIAFLLSIALAIPIVTVSQMTGSNCSGQLTIASRHEGNREIYLLTSGNYPFINVTNNPEADDFNPVWSPDGRYLAFNSHQQGGRTKLQLFDMDTNNTVTLAEAHGATYRFHAVWARNGQQIAFVTQEGGLAVADTHGVTRRIVNADFRLRTPVTWSLDGNYVVFSSQVFDNPPTSGETWNISTANVRAGEIETLASIKFLFDGSEGPREPNWLYWLPDNNHLIITRSYPGGPPGVTVDILDLETMMLRRVDDRIIAFDRPYLDNMSLLYWTGYDLNVLDLNTGAVHNLTDHIDDQLILRAWSPSTKTIAFNTKENLNHIYLTDIERNILLHITELSFIDSIVWRPTKCP